MHNDDVEGAGPRMLHIGLNKPEYNLTNNDIAGSKTQILKFITTRQPSNPLNPVYKLPSFTVVPPEPPKFVRDAMIIEDIDGTRPKAKKTFAPRDTLNCFDIDGAKAKVQYKRNTVGDTGYSNIAYNDVTKKPWASRRCTNPNDPVYVVWDESSGEFGKPKESQTINNDYGKIDGSKPAGLPKSRAGVRNLNTLDIDGAQNDTRNKGAFTWISRR